MCYFLLSIVRCYPFVAILRILQSVTFCLQMLAFTFHEQLLFSIR